MNKFLENLGRRDSGYLRLFISILLFVVAYLVFSFGYNLIKLGTSGSWEIVSSFKGVGLYIASLSPGLFFVIAGILILGYALPKILKNL